MTMSKLSTDKRMYSQPDLSNGLWICPHRFVNDEEDALKLLSSIAPEARRKHSEPFQPCSVLECIQRTGYYIIRLPPLPHLSSPRETFTLRTGMSLLNAEIGSGDSLSLASTIFTKGRVQQALLGLDLPICNHTRISDKLVLDHYQPKCLIFAKLDGRFRPCVCTRADPKRRPLGDHFKPCPKCETQGCSTTFGFRAEEHECDGRRYLNLTIHFYRRLGALDGSTPLDWTCHSSKASVLRTLPDMYLKWVRSRRSQIPPHEVHHQHSSKHTALLNHVAEMFHATLTNIRPPKYVEDEQAMRSARESYFKRRNAEQGPWHTDAKSQGGEETGTTHRNMLDDPPPYVAMEKKS